VAIALLRAVNLAGRNRIRMVELRAICESLGLRDVATYVQSGNVVFRATTLNGLAARIEDAIEKKLRFRPAVILRTAGELRDAIARSPFAGRRDLDPARLLVTFLADEPAARARSKIAAIQADPEEVYLAGRELYVFYPNGLGRSKFPQAAVDKALATPGTARNWNTVTKLMEMAAALE
jgi:uncharacterized protein (DUF1697 family)